MGVLGVSLWAHGEATSSKNRAHLPGGNGESSPGGCPEPPARPTGGGHLQRTGHTGLRGEKVCRTSPCHSASSTAYTRFLHPLSRDSHHP